MTDQRDPVEAWLSKDVELMPPPPGAFDRIHRRARRRKTVRAVSAGAGAAVIVAAAATLPQYADLMSQPTGTAQVGESPSTTRSTGPAALTATPAAPPPGAGPALASAGTGAAPAAGFHPISVTFVGDGPGRILGAALGVAGSCGTGPCIVMAGTRDYGAHWTRIGAPKA